MDWKYTWIDEGASSGPVTGINRDPVAPELGGTESNQSFVWGVDAEAYSIVAGVFTAMTQAEYDALLAQRAAEVEYQENMEWAKESQTNAIAILQQNTTQTVLGMENLESDTAQAVGAWAQKVEDYRISLIASGPGGPSIDRPPVPPELEGKDFYDLVYGG